MWPPDARVVLAGKMRWELKRNYIGIGPLSHCPQRIRVCLSIWIQTLLDCLLVGKFSHFSPHPPLSTEDKSVPQSLNSVSVCLLDCVFVCGQILSFISSSSSVLLYYGIVKKSLLWITNNWPATWVSTDHSGKGGLSFWIHWLFDCLSAHIIICFHILLCFLCSIVLCLFDCSLFDCGQIF